MLTALLTVKDLAARTGCGQKTKVYKNTKEGLFPEPVRWGGRSFWPSNEVDAVIAARIAGKPDDEIRELVSKLAAERKETA